ncbi:hypothetical protein C0993_001344, partial [Termitomyces sp. T159_Od127]
RGKVTRPESHHVRNEPAYDGISLAHVGQVFKQFPHGGISNFYLVNVNSQQRKPRSTQKIGYVLGVWI